MDAKASDALEHALAGLGAETMVDDTCETSVAESVEPDVVVIDIDGAGFDAERIAAQFASAVPESAIILLSDHVNDAVMQDALLAGAAGVLRRDVSARALSRAVFGVAAGEAAVPRSTQVMLLDQLRGLADDGR
jgi:DNA-binding NarL/FixJ family response regulator